MRLGTMTTGGRNEDTRPVTRRRRGADPDLKTLQRLYVDERRTEREIAQLLGVSRSRVAEAMDEAGIERRTPNRACPVSAAGLQKAFVAPGATIASVARRFDASDATVARWLAEAGLLPPDPGIDHRRLKTLYVDKALTIAEVAEKFRISPARVARELVVAGIAIRSHTVRRPQGNRAKVTDKRLVDLYVKKKLNVAATARLLGVSTEYLSKRLHEAGLAKRPGTFTPKGPWDPDDLRDEASRLYEDGMTMKAVGQELGVSVGTVRVALHQSGVQVRRGGFASHTDEGRTLLDDLYGDPKILKVLTRHRVVVPEEWSLTGPFESLAPLPLSRGLVTALYEDVGLPILHMSLLLGVGQGAVRSGLKAAGVDLRPKGQDAPWTTRHRSG
jgi:transposase-like protein